MKSGLVSLNRILNKRDKEDTLYMCLMSLQKRLRGFNTPRKEVDRMRQVVDVGDGMWKLKYTDSHAYRMQVTMTSVENPKPGGSRWSIGRTAPSLRTAGQSGLFFF